MCATGDEQGSATLGPEVEAHPMNGPQEQCEPSLGSSMADAADGFISGSDHEVAVTLEVGPDCVHFQFQQMLELELL